MCRLRLQEDIVPQYTFPAIEEEEMDAIEVPTPDQVAQWEINEFLNSIYARLARVFLLLAAGFVFVCSMIKFGLLVLFTHPVVALVVVICMLVYRVVPWLPSWLYGFTCLVVAVVSFCHSFIAMVVEDVEEPMIKLTPDELKDIEDSSFAAGFMLATVIYFGILVVVYLVFKICKSRVLTVEAEVVKTEAPKVGFVAERVMAGSVFAAGKLQPFMFWVDVQEEGAWYQKGLGFRTAEGCFTALHVVYGGEKLRFRNMDFSKEVDFDQGKLLDGDAMLFPEDCAPMGTTRAVLSRTPIMQYQQMVQITNGTQMSVGPLIDSQLFGTVYYKGSTVGGFSGAPYFSGKTVFGMHTGSEAFNCGYEAAYLRALVKREEDSDEYFLSKLRAGRRFKHRISPYDPDEVMIKTEKGYYTMDWKEFQRASLLEDQSREPDEHMDGMPMKASRTKSERRLLNKYNSVLHSSHVHVPENCQEPAVVASTSAGKPLSSPPVAPPRNSLTCQETRSASQKDSQAEDTDPQRSMRAPKSEVSPPMSPATPEELAQLMKEVARLNSSFALLRNKLTQQ